VVIQLKNSQAESWAADDGGVQLTKSEFKMDDSTHIIVHIKHEPVKVEKTSFVAEKKS
jgi:hypothetical protein